MRRGHPRPSHRRDKKSGPQPTARDFTTPLTRPVTGLAVAWGAEYGRCDPDCFCPFGGSHVAAGGVMVAICVYGSHADAMTGERRPGHRHAPARENGSNDLHRAVLGLLSVRLGGSVTRPACTTIYVLPRSSLPRIPPATLQPESAARRGSEEGDGRPLRGRRRSLVVCQSESYRSRMDCIWDISCCWDSTIFLQSSTISGSVMSDS